ncbi:hypothetical protein ACP70R_033118 [Stipagrostis hirtigluma subsp. patula]
MQNYTTWSIHGENRGMAIVDSRDHEIVTTYEVDAVTYDPPRGSSNDFDDGVDAAADDDDGFDLEAMLGHAEPEVVKGTAKGLSNYENLEKAARDYCMRNQKVVARSTWYCGEKAYMPVVTWSAGRYQVEIERNSEEYRKKMGLEIQAIVQDLIAKAKMEMSVYIARAMPRFAVDEKNRVMAVHHISDHYIAFMMYPDW